MNTAQEETPSRWNAQNLQFAIDAAQVGTFYCDWPFDKIIWNTLCEHHFFLEPDAEVDFALFYSLLHPDDRERTRAAIDRAISEGVEYNVEYRAVSQEGQVRWINAVGRGSYDEFGVPVRFDGITIDITARKEAEAEAERLRAREHRIAEELQAALQPPVPAEVPGLALAVCATPALEEAAIGGDFYDVFALDKEVYAVVVGDVSGKGLAAAAQLATVRNMLRGVLYQFHAPASAAASLNTIVTMHDLLIGFVTVFVGLYNARSGEIVYASCGHEPGLLHRFATGEVAPLMPTGPPLGIAENAAYDSGRVTLASGDMLLLSTDGLSEAGPTRLDLLGMDGMARLLRECAAEADTQAAADSLVAAAQAYAGGIFRDDVCTLLLRRQ